MNYEFHFRIKIFFNLRTQPQTRFNPSNSLTQGLKQPTTIKSVPTPYETTSKTHQLPPRPTSYVRPTVAQWPSSDDQNELRASSSAGFLDDVKRMVSNFIIDYQNHVSNSF